MLACAGAAQAAQEFLPPEQAFKASVTVPDARTLEVSFAIAKGYYMYREQFAFTATPDAVRLGAPVYPRGLVKYDETFAKELETYHDQVAIRIPIETPGQPFTLTIRSQGCADKGICYPPMDTSYAIRDGAATLLAEPAISGTTEPPAAAPAATAGEDETSRIASALASRNLLTIAALFFGLGLLLTFTPCVLPMVPILSSIVVGEHVSRTRALWVSLAYVAGMAVVYTAIGVAAGLLGEGLAATLQKPWVIGLFAALMVALALSMFGLYELQLPARWQAALTAASQRQSGGQLAGAAGMGALSALIVGPCVTAPLAGVLAYIAQTGDAVIGGSALFAMALGMGVPLVLVGVGAGNLLPRAGRWMENTKRFFGFLLLAVAIWMVALVAPAWVGMVAWAAWLLLGATFLGAFDALGEGAGGIRRLGKGVGIIAAVCGVLLLLGLASGGRDPLQPLAHLSVSRANASSQHGVTFERVRSVVELEAAVAEAARQQRPVMLDFYADWCISCKEMERFTFVDPRVQQALSNVVLLQADVTANNADDKALLKRFDLFGPPGILFFGKDGKELPVRVIGFQSADKFVESLARAGFTPGA
ncbi:MAG TPA: protein-disulfide reductase DsbD [Burkholderiaceae bacterium]|nr:protein-disulfide reductase DsbD [Burkholderiaceae bacterium]